MKNFWSLIVIFIVFTGCLLSCKKEEKIPVDIFTITADGFASTTATDNWVVIWNTEGELLAYEPYTLNEKLTLSTTGNLNNGLIDVAFITHEESGGRTYGTIKTYANIPLGQGVTQEFTRLRSSESQAASDIGPFQVNLDMTETSRNVIITNNFGFLAGSGSTETAYACRLDSRASTYNVMFRTDHEIKHKLITDVKVDDVINLSQEDFTPYENLLTYDLPERAAVQLFAISGIESDSPQNASGYSLDFLIPNEFAVTPSITTGYFDPISKFDFYLRVFHLGQNAETTYIKRGSAAAAIAWPDVTKLKIESTDPMNFVVSSLLPATFVHASWSVLKNNSQVRWEVTSSSPAFKIRQLPQELLDLHPEFTVQSSDFEYVDVGLGQQTYARYLKQEIEMSRANELEVTMVTLRK